MASDRITVKLPPGFSPERHVRALLKMITEQHGEGFEIETINTDDNVAYATRGAAFTTVTADASNDRFDVLLARGTKPSDGDSRATKLADQYPGYFMVRFEPFLNRASLARLDEATLRAREAVAGVIGVKPWDVQCTPRVDGGFDLVLPAKYTPSKHDDKLDEVATEVVGREGWYVAIDANKLTGSIIPSDPPTFPSTVPYPFSAPMKTFRPGNSDWARVPLGVVLPRAGQRDHLQFVVDLEASPHSACAGVSGAGKSVTVNSFIAGVLARGAELAIVDLPSKAQPLTTRIPVPISERFKGGWALLGDLGVGDHVYAADGAPTAITALTPAQQGAVYEVEFSDGQVVRADAGHLWSVSTRADRARRSHSYRAGRVAIAEKARVALSARVSDIQRRADSADSFADTTELARIAQVSKSYASRLALQWKPQRRDTFLTNGRQIAEYSVSEFVAAYLTMLATDLEDRTSPREQASRLVTTAKMIDSTRVGRRGLSNYAVTNPEPIRAPRADLPIPPYVLGVWLGDGAASTCQITSGHADVGEMLKNLSAEWQCDAEVAEFSNPGSVQIILPRPNQHLCPYGHDNFRIETRGTRTCRTCLRKGGRVGVKNQSLYSKLQAEGLRLNKHIPPSYLRASFEQRLALLQGLMDTDGMADNTGYCSFTSVSDRLTQDVVELCRSLGMAPSLSTHPTTLTESDGAGGRRRRHIGTANNISFSTHLPVFRLSRKAQRLESRTATDNTNRFIVGIRPVQPEPVRCITIAHPGHLYLTEGFIPTHNCVDFLWAKDFVRPGFWGCDSLAAAVTTMALVYQEGQRRAQVLARYEVTNWKDLPAAAEPMRPLAVVVDELTGLFYPEKIPKGLPKDSPLVIEPMEINLQKAMLEKHIKRTAAELRFVGIKLLLATQVASTTTGIDTSLRMNLSNKLLLGVNPTDGNRRLSLTDPTRVPKVPGNVQRDPQAGRGTGVAELEGAEPCVFKSYFATTDQFRRWLLDSGVPTTDAPSPTAAQIALHTPTLDSGEPAGRTQHGTQSRSMRNTGLGADWATDENGEQLSGYAKANAARHAAGSQSGAANR